MSKHAALKEVTIILVFVYVFTFLQTLVPKVAPQITTKAGEKGYLSRSMNTKCMSHRDEL